MRLVVVTGTPGWLGTSLVEALVKGAKYAKVSSEPCRVRCAVEPCRPFPPAELARLGDNVEFVKVDLRYADQVSGLCERADAVFHCAGIIHPQRIQQLYDINVQATRNLLHEAIRAQVNKFLFVSSNSPAGLNANPTILLDEKDPPRPYLNYGLSKLQSEWLVNDACRGGKIQTVILRPCWFYGPNQPKRQSRFFQMIKKGHPIVIGKGDNLRSMSYIDNTVQALMLAYHVDKAIGNTYWVADRRPYSFIEIIETVARVLDVSVRPRYLPSVASDIARFVDSVVQMAGFYNQEIHVAGELAATIAVSIDAAVRDLGYDPQIELEEGMRRSIKWCREQGIDL